MVGEVVEVDLGKSGECSGKFLRVRVRIDVTIPLRRCLRVDVMGDGEEIVMVLGYEHLPNHCFLCGRISHSTQECPEATLVMEAERVEERSFGAWLRAIGLEKLGGQKGRRSNNFYRSSSARYTHEKTVERKFEDTTVFSVGRREHGVFGYKADGEELNVQRGKGLNVSQGVIEDQDRRRDWGDIVNGDITPRDFVFKSKNMVTNEEGGPGEALCGPEQASIKGKGKVEVWAL
ncbi:hypothetical protein Dsin_002491 [Dipteronia sinensis]|uniref:CCHC-type domain-containing protein n=1 Tax=Dipteronia sinensis TaxID=43782 RepID=A0AAE0B763_9ROSI|nr:hypothetical protein Dsin_002491 [Dipteronia sinensis]